MTPNDQTPTDPQQPVSPTPPVSYPRMFGGNLQARYQGMTGWQKALIAVGIVLGVIVLACCSCSTLMALPGKGATTTPTHGIQQQQQTTPGTKATPTTPATKAPTQPAATATPQGPVLKLSGNGTKQSPTFHVNGQWKITYHCDNTSSIQTVPFYINVYNSDGTATFDSVTANCPKGGLSDESIIHDGGDKYLSIIAMSPWSLQVIDIP